MSDQDRNKWNQRYSEGSYHKNNPVTFLQEWLPKFRVGRALDVACGAGRNAVLLAQAGYEVDAIDISSEGLKLARQSAEKLAVCVNWIEQDLDQPYLFDTGYDLIVVMWYVNLGLISRLCDCLAPGGCLLCEEHLRTDEEVIGPANPDFRVAPGELRGVVSGMDVLLYEESIQTDAEGEKVASARMIVRKP